MNKRKTMHVEDLLLSLLEIEIDNFVTLLLSLLVVVSHK